VLDTKSNSGVECSEISKLWINYFTFISSIKGENPPTSVMKLRTETKKQSNDPLSWTMHKGIIY